jgi:hypothetical protein
MVVVWIVKRNGKGHPIVQRMVKVVKYVELVRKIGVEIGPLGVSHCSTSEIHSNVKFNSSPLCECELIHTRLVQADVSNK